VRVVATERIVANNALNGNQPPSPEIEDLDLSRQRER
jgi:hypothetical protein